MVLEKGPCGIATREMALESKRRRLAEGARVGLTASSEDQPVPAEEVSAADEKLDEEKELPHRIALEVSPVSPLISTLHLR